MACASCGTDGVSKGCGNKGHCQSGSCNKLNTYDWLSSRDIPTVGGQRLVEVSFKNGARKDFFKLDTREIQAITGDVVVVDSGNGYDIGSITLSGDLVYLQMKKKKHSEDRINHSVIRIANQRDLERLAEARSKEMQSMVKARVIARDMGLDMKVGDVEYQGDLRKATFYYTAEGRVDFRELVRAFAREFRVKIEMRQIGSRQESARIGGIGSCGRELCCSTWLTDFKSVSTSAARYQYMAINQSKLSGQCGRLKCCLNYELDNYMDTMSTFPEKADVLKTKYTKAHLLKIDIFKGLMYYSVKTDKGRGPIVVMDKQDVKEVLEMNRNGQFPEDLTSFTLTPEVDDDFQDYEDVTGAVELPARKKKRRNTRSKNRSKNRNPNNKSNRNSGQRKNSKSEDSKSNITDKNRNKGKVSEKADSNSKSRNSKSKPNHQNKSNNRAKDGKPNNNTNTKNTNSNSKKNRSKPNSNDNKSKGNNRNKRNNQNNQKQGPSASNKNNNK